ncbi:hypothetical protein I7I50_07979 [Histoplasma capsulatum G186AR]|uniref:Transmembrane protein n=1 Tax=Ajellomyces capsulatus TaxID=5037 RepID=A0A8H7YGU6_AJECA|nr:hypothetical protein I7I52_08495 [Histoplasma capsulatum]QSS68535.1 hypothetical protein I7I50_07979 [Histoplasma capsulatum G186AR]
MPEENSGVVRSASRRATFSSPFVAPNSPSHSIRARCFVKSVLATIFAAVGGLLFYSFLARCEIVGILFSSRGRRGEGRE